MRIANFLVPLSILALALSVALAYDPSPLQDFCVATDDTSSGAFVNGKFCKDPEHVTADDFYHTGLNIARPTSDQLGVRTNLLTVEEIPGLNTLALSIVRIDFEAGGVNPPHHHPRASEIITVLEGTLYAGFITGNPDHKAFVKILKAGDVFVFPFGLIHFQFNIGKSPAVAIAALNSQNPIGKSLQLLIGRRLRQSKSTDGLLQQNTILMGAVLLLIFKLFGKSFPS
ncbi:germin-like protein subfamily 1 member 11 [Jatropha curcas]|uniref:germin-like protein subfamily 1 member 11 n=1 Tax=Jatropha curcas TaxID=180498 RepID=UPI001895704C|nr:germin-like protein subfamily 1 member 11 [Jatropha curcas]